MKRTVLSSRPRGAFSDSISVTKPYLYFSPASERAVSAVSAEIDGAVWLMMPWSRGFRMFRRSGRAGNAGARPLRPAGVRRHAGHLGQGHAVERVPHRLVDAVPAMTVGADRLDVAGARSVLDAQGECDRAV